MGNFMAKPRVAHDDDDRRRQGHSASYQPSSHHNGNLRSPPHQNGYHPQQQNGEYQLASQHIGYSTPSNEDPKLPPQQSGYSRPSLPQNGDIQLSPPHNGSSPSMPQQSHHLRDKGNSLPSASVEASHQGNGLRQVPPQHDGYERLPPPILQQSGQQLHNGSDDDKLEQILRYLKTQNDDSKTLKAGLETLKAGFETLNAHFETLMATLNTITCEKGDKKSRLFTVKIRRFVDTGESQDNQPPPDNRVERRNVTGHGMVLVLGDQNPRYFLLSASHVLAELVALQQEKDEKKHILECRYELIWGKDEKTQDAVECTTPIHLTNLYLSEDYVKFGTRDVGVAEIDRDMFSTVLTEKKHQFKVDELHFRPARSTVGDAVVGHGRVLMQGKVIDSCFETDRMMVQATSVSGCSGSPMFDCEGEVVALVHGPSKHRGRSIGKHSDPASFFYADSVGGQRLKLVHESCYKRAYYAEGIPPVLFANCVANKTMRELKEACKDKEKMDELGLEEPVDFSHLETAFFTDHDKEVLDKGEDRAFSEKRENEFENATVNGIMEKLRSDMFDHEQDTPTVCLSGTERFVCWSKKQ